MNLLLSATHTVSDVRQAAGRFQDWLGYRCVEQGQLDPALAASWATPASAGRPYAVLQPASGAEVFLRLVEGDPVPEYRPIRTYGWAALEICVQDVLAVNQLMLQAGSPYEVIGPPSRIPGLPTIHPMQVRGPDLETVYFTQILTDDPASGLPRAGSLIDKLFILVLACPDMRQTADWFAQSLRLHLSDPMAIPYTMISKAFDQPLTQLHEIMTAKWQGDVFLEFDQYPADATERPCHPAALPPGVSICTLLHPEFDGLQLDWLTKPVERDGAIYQGRRTGVVLTPEGALLEIVAGD